MPMLENILGKKIPTQGAVISIDPLTKSIQFCAPSKEHNALGSDSIPYQPQAFTEDFYTQLTQQLTILRENNPTIDLQKASVLLPDQLFLMDTVSIPIIHRKAMQHSLSLAIEAIYKNADELSLMTYSVQQTKQTATFGLSGVRQDLLENVRRAFAESGITVTGITFASNAMVNGAFALNSKIRNDTFLLMDIKENCTRFAIVVRGVTMGYYDLPFGYNILSASHLVSEDTLFDHRAGEHLVQNAINRARAKPAASEDTFGESAQDTGSDTTERRSARKLPKFLQRPAPQSREEFGYENFRIFLKWTLALIEGNQNILSLAKPDRVYVNMPEEYNYLYDIINKRRESHGIVFSPLLSEGSDVSFAEILELYGGFFLGQYNPANTF